LNALWNHPINDVLAMIAASTPMPVHVVLDGPVTTTDSVWSVRGTVVSAALGFISLLLGGLSLYLSVTAERRERDRLRPHCDMSDVVTDVQGRDQHGEVVRFDFKVSNVGGGPAVNVLLTLEAYGTLSH